MIIEIQYKDKENWTPEIITGKAVNWDNYSRKYKDQRVQPFYVAPTIIKDIWNGIEHDVQHITHESYYCEIYVEESEVHDIQRLKSCSDIKVIQHNQVNGVYTLDVEYIVDTLTADYFNVGEPVRAADTSSWKVPITFRTNRTIAQKTAPETEDYFIELDGVPTYSNYQIIEIYDEKPSVTENWTVDQEKVLLAYHRGGFEILLYFNPTELVYFLTYLKYSQVRKINGWTVQEYSYEQAQIGVDLISVRVRCITSISQFPKLNFSTYSLVINGTSYYTDLQPVLVDGNSVIESVENQTGVNKAVKAITRTVKQITFFMTETNVLALKQAWELSITQTVTLDGDTVLERSPVTAEKLGYNLYKLPINCTIGVTTS